MFGRRYFGGRYFAPRYFGDGDNTSAGIYNATILVDGKLEMVPSSELGLGHRPIVYVGGRFREVLAGSEGVPLIFDPVTNRWRLLDVSETINI
jgi:hypothetical protein